jgi:hypothetical protein
MLLPLSGWSKSFIKLGLARFHTEFLSPVENCFPWVVLPPLAIRIPRLGRLAPQNYQAPANIDFSLETKPLDFCGPARRAFAA